MAWCKKTRIKYESRIVGGSGGAAANDPDGNYGVWEWVPVEEEYWELCDPIAIFGESGLRSSFDGPIRNGFGEKPGSLLPILLPPDAHKPQDAPCRTCNYQAYPGDPRGGVISYSSKYGSTVIDRYIRVGRNWVENPLIKQLGISILGDGIFDTRCNCLYSLGQDDYTPPQFGSPDYDPGCDENVRYMLRQYPNVTGCDESVKQLITRALYDACRKIGNNNSEKNDAIKQAYKASDRDSNSNLAKILDCMSDPNLMASTITNIDCMSLPYDRVMYTNTFVNNNSGITNARIMIDMGKVYSEVQTMNSATPTPNPLVTLSDVMASFLLHEMTHICTAKIWGLETEAENWILTILLYGKEAPESKITKSRMRELCYDKKVLEERKDQNVSKNLIVTGSFVINLDNGEVYALPVVAGDSPLFVLLDKPFDHCP